MSLGIQGFRIVVMCFQFAHQHFSLLKGLHLFLQIKLDIGQLHPKLSCAQVPPVIGLVIFVIAPDFLFIHLLVSFVVIINGRVDVAQHDVGMLQHIVMGSLFLEDDAHEQVGVGVVVIFRQILAQERLGLVILLGIEQHKQVLVLYLLPKSSGGQGNKTDYDG